ncbi:type 1 glutamine amidotransferase [Agrococcus sediminis]|jgi:protease I|uniref:Type 1 glutamine amidotransferase n=1 Tax=Agrococcus sediminis TaxID=2599924 RepID=A0A5M8QJG3_9MICO|nr:MULTISPECIES: type 1 glutamine amidotransferase domain-containing protein [Agrococcus]KAA6436205.1 type 1 glutamine amidotransferase [Agrococcus sediminis]RWR21926.1 type 1 glutamine amidotransferase [Agrococcus lahaulensis]UOW01598.1 type 1 glutamine amidotransferase [Agrococcus sp. SCSIO52902]
MADITGKKVAFVLTDGYEDSELTSPWEAVQGAGGQPTLLAPKDGQVEGKKGHTQAVDGPVSGADASDYDALVLPGGVVNADHLRMDEDAVALVRGFVESGKPIGVICHGAWILIEAGGVEGRTITSYPSLRTDLRNAGAQWVDQEVATDKGLVSSRTPDDLPAFNAKVLEEIAEGVHPR